jgi:hypothetical protein
VTVETELEWLSLGELYCQCTYKKAGPSGGSERRGTRMPKSESRTPQLLKLEGQTSSLPLEGRVMTAIIVDQSLTKKKYVEIDHDIRIKMTRCDGGPGE